MGESIYFDLATLCEQTSLPFDEVRRAANNALRRHARSSTPTVVF